MLALSPEKLLVVLVVALILLGPDKLPQFSRQLGSAWSALRRTHERVEEEVRSAMPDLPSTQDIARAVRSPVALLDSLARMEPGGTETNSTVTTTTEDNTTEPTGTAPEGATWAQAGTPDHHGAVRADAGALQLGAEETQIEVPDPAFTGAAGSEEPPAAPATSGSFRVPDDPSMN